MRLGNVSTMTPTFPLVTERLTLRPYAEGDFEDYKTYYSRDDVATYLYWSPGDEAKLRDSFATRQTQHVWQADAPLVLAAERKSDARVIGEVLLIWRNAEQREGELGFVFHPDVHGQGYACEASLAMLELGFGTFGLHRIIGRCDARNTASYTLMERLGMRREAHFIDNEYLKGEWTSELVYALLEREWQEARR